MMNCDRLQEGDKMDNKKAKLIFDKMQEIKEIVKTEPNNYYFTIHFRGDYMSFNNDPKEVNFYNFDLINGKIKEFEM